MLIIFPWHRPSGACSSFAESLYLLLAPMMPPEGWQRLELVFPNWQAFASGFIDPMMLGLSPMLTNGPDGHKPALHHRARMIAFAHFFSYNAPMKTGCFL